MTPKQYSFAVAEAASYDNIDAYISDLATSSIWEDAADAQIPATRAEDLRQIWTAVHRSFKQILNDACVTQAKFCARFAVPKRTVEAWSMGERACAVYDRLMFQQLLGLLRVKVQLFEFAYINKYKFAEFPETARMYYEYRDETFVRDRFTFAPGSIVYWGEDAVNARHAVSSNAYEADNYLDSALDGFCDGCNDIFRFPDGKLYAVERSWCGDFGYLPLMWREVIENKQEDDPADDPNIERKYIVVDEFNYRDYPHGSGDSWQYVYDTPEEANAQASMRWHHLTSQGRQKRHVYAGVITQDDLADDAVDEDTGEVDWKRWNNCNTFPGALDSYNLEEEEEE